VGGGKGGNKMVLIRPDCALGGVGAVVDGWDVLIITEWGEDWRKKTERSSLVSLSKMR
jgi:hypothetical protein